KELTRDVFLFAAMLRDRLEMDPQLNPAGLMNEAQTHFSAMDHEAGKYPALEQRYHQIRFALVALIDDMIFNSSWDQRTQWAYLEMQHYGTQIGGDRVYELLEAFGPAEHDLTELFFYVLALGFRGRYSQNPAQWESTLQGLFLGLKQPVAKDLKLSPEAYHVITRKSRRLDPLFSLWRSVLIFAICFVMLFVFYKVAWNDVVRKARQKSEQVITKLNDDNLRQSLQEVDQ
ncbi:MAG: DotU family type IV/VI secretion system protein, partial [Acidobacteriota bacterium]|nr:DotU family type IV/VI secretion system protein [Acidobacteriota bacterium]